MSRPAGPTGMVFVALVGVGALSAFGTIYALAIEPRDEQAVASETTTAGSSEVIDLSGEWTIVEGSEVGYRLRSSFGGSAADIEGETGAIKGDMRVDYQRGAYVISEIDVEVDMAKVAAESSTGAAAPYIQALEIDRFPTATFTGTKPMIVPQPQRGTSTVAFYLEGAMTVHGITRQVSIPVQADLGERRLEAMGSLLFPMADFGINPTYPGDVEIEPNATLEFQLLLEKAG